MPNDVPDNCMESTSNMFSMRAQNCLQVAIDNGVDITLDSK